MLLGFINLAQLKQELAEVALELRAGGFALDGLAKLCQRLLVAVEHAQSVGQIVVRKRITRVEFERFGKRANSFFQPACRHECKPEVRLRLQKARLDFERALAMLYGVSRVTRGAISLSKIGVHGRNARLDNNSLANERNRALCVAALVRNHAQQVQRIRVIRVLAPQKRIGLLGLLKPARAML
jgi:hypothetical protein